MMKQIHERLMERKGWYAFWHGHKAHQVAHWLVLVSVSLFLTTLVLTSIGKGQASADISSQLVTFPNDKIAFIIGPQLKSGSPLNPHPWFDQVANSRGVFWGEAFPAVPPMRLTGTVSLTSGSTIVTGTGTKFLSEISTATLQGSSDPSKLNYQYFKSNRLTVPSGSAQISSVQSDTQLTLAAPWSSSTVNGVIADTNYQGNENQYLFGNYYDQALIQYTNYYRTGDARYLNYARKIADSYWKLPFSNEGRERRFDVVTLNPRHASLSGLMLRAMDPGDPRPEMWDWINAYTRYHFNLWLVTGPGRTNNSELFYGVREGAYMLLYATELAKVLPDSYPLTAGGTENNGAALRAKYLTDAENVAVNYYGKLQGKNGRKGSWTWDDFDVVDRVVTSLTSPAAANATSISVAPLRFPIQSGQKVDFAGRGETKTRAPAPAGSTTLLVNPLVTAQESGREVWIDDGMLRGITQPFQIGLLIQALGDLYNLSTDETAKQSIRTQIIDGVEALHNGPYIPGPSGISNYKWRGYHYFYYGGTTLNPTKYANGSEPVLAPDRGWIENARAATGTILHSYGVAYKLTDDPKYRAWGDDVFSSGWGDVGDDAISDGIHNYANTSGEPKSYNESFRTAGRYLAYRLMGSGGTTPPPPPSGDTTPPTVLLTAPLAATTATGSVTVSATALDNVGVSGVQFKLDGVNLGAEDTSFPYSVSWNTTTTSNGNHAITATARDAAGNTTTSSGVAVTVSNIIPLPGGDTTPPTATITSPTNGSPVSGTVTVSAAASDNSGVVDIVYFVVDGSVVGSDATAPYSFNWNTASLSNGSRHTIGVRAWDKAGNAGDASTVNVTVGSTAVIPVSDTTPPTATITSPTNGSPVSGTVTVSANASDNVAVDIVYFVVDGSVVGSDATFPYTFNWNTAPLGSGSHTLRVRAWDTSGNAGDSAVVSVNVGGGTSDTTAPTIAITSPANGSTVPNKGNLIITASAADNSSTVSSIKLHFGGTLVRTCTLATSCSFSQRINAIDVGTHTITAVATDPSGNSADTSVSVVKNKE